MPVVLVATAEVVKLNVVFNAPAGIVTDVGSVTAVLVVVRLIVAPPVGAAVGMATWLLLTAVPPRTEEAARASVTGGAT